MKHIEGATGRAICGAVMEDIEFATLPESTCPECLVEEIYRVMIVLTNYRHQIARLEARLREAEK